MNNRKLLSEDNWLQLDPAYEKSAGIPLEVCLKIMAQLHANGPGNYDIDLKDVPLIPAKEWIRRILRFKLHSGVPPELRELFSGAQAMLAYSCFYYPLCSLASDQLTRTLEAVVARKCAEMGGPSKKRYQDKLEWLREKGVITQEQWFQWDRTRILRNCGSHPKQQSLFPTAVVEYLFESLASDIGRLFPEPKSA